MTVKYKLVLAMLAGAAMGGGYSGALRRKGGRRPVS